MGKRIANDWAKDHIAALQRGEKVRFRPVGGSMKGVIESGDLVEVEPAAGVAQYDVVLVQIGGFTYLHFVKDIKYGRDDGDTRYLIGNNRSGINGWVERNAIYGVLTAVNPPEHTPA